MKQQQEAILARDMIQMIREYKDNANVLEYIESFASSVARLVESAEVTNWEDIAGVCDQRYYSLNHGTAIDLNADLLDRCERSLSTFLPTEAA